MIAYLIGALFVIGMGLLLYLMGALFFDYEVSVVGAIVVVLICGHLGVLVVDFDKQSFEDEYGDAVGSDLLLESGEVVELVDVRVDEYMFVVRNDEGFEWKVSVGEVRAIRSNGGDG